MRKRLINSIFCLLLIGSIFLVVNGISILNIKGFIEISEKNKVIDTKISDLSDFININYPNALSDLKQAANTLTETKTGYENQKVLSNSSDPSYASQQEKYDIEYLWTKLGNYARDENVVIKIDLVSSETDASLYCLKFSVTGDYTNTTNFIYDIENDSNLGFKIDNFEMVGTRNYRSITYNIYL